MEKRVLALPELCYRNGKLRNLHRFNLLNTGILNLWPIAYWLFRVVMYFPRAAYHPIWSSTGQPLCPCGQEITFWEFGNWPTFIAIYSIPCSHDQNLWHFFVINWLIFLVSGKKRPIGCNVHLMTTANKVIKKIRHGHVVTLLTTNMTYDHNSRLNYHHKSKTACSSSIILQSWKSQ